MASVRGAAPACSAAPPGNRSEVATPNTPRLTTRATRSHIHGVTNVRGFAQSGTDRDATLGTRPGRAIAHPTGRAVRRQTHGRPEPVTECDTTALQRVRERRGDARSPNLSDRDCHRRTVNTDLPYACAG